MMIKGTRDGMTTRDREGGREEKRKREGEGRENFSRLEVGSQPKSIQSKDGSDLKGAGAVRARSLPGYELGQLEDFII